MQQHPAKRIPNRAPEQTTPDNAFYKRLQIREQCSAQLVQAPQAQHSPTEKQITATHIILPKQAARTGCTCPKLQHPRMLAQDPSESCRRAVQSQQDGSMQLSCESIAPDVVCLVPCKPQTAKPSSAEQWLGCYCCLSGLPGAMVDRPLASGCVPGPDAVLLPGPEAEDRREDPTLFTRPATGPPPPLLPPAQLHSKPQQDPTNGNTVRT
jgi:hypothetical protein